MRNRATIAVGHSPALNSTAEEVVSQNAGNVGLMITVEGANSAEISFDGGLTWHTMASGKSLEDIGIGFDFKGAIQMRSTAGTDVSVTQFRP